MVHIVCTGCWPPTVQAQNMSVHTNESYYTNIRVCSLITACYSGEWLPDSKVHGANMGPIGGRQDPGGPHVGPMNFAIWGCIVFVIKLLQALIWLRVYWQNTNYFSGRILPTSFEMIHWRMKLLIDSQTQRCIRWSLGMDKWFYPRLYRACDFLSTLRLKLIDVCRGGPWSETNSASRSLQYSVVLAFRIPYDGPSSCHGGNCILLYDQICMKYAKSSGSIFR